MKNAVLYIHGKSGSAAECGHYQPLFPDCEVFGLDYQTSTPWETGAEILAAVERLKTEYENIVLIANSIGAFFSMNAGIDSMIQKAYFISPIVDMEKLIGDMMLWASVTETELKAKGVIRTEFGEDLSWDYLCYVREHPIQWSVPTSILYGSSDNLTSLETVRAFAEKHGAALTVMEGGEHWFHTAGQMQYLDDWIRKCGRPQERAGMSVKQNTLTPELFLKIYTSVGWEPPCMEQIKTALSHTAASFTAYDGERPVGMARLIGDGGMSFYLKDFAVIPGCQGKGVGTMLIDAVETFIRDAIRPGWAVSLELISTKEAVPFYLGRWFEERPCGRDGPGMFKMIRKEG